MLRKSIIINIFNQQMMKVYLPAFDLTTTVPSVKAAAILQQGMLELLQYRGNCIQHFDDIEKENNNNNNNINSLVGVMSKQQIFASILWEMPWKETLEKAKTVQNNTPNAALEKWELAYAEACGVFCQFKFEECSLLCVKNLQDTPSDVFSLRLLFISAYFCSDTDLVATALLNALAHFRKVQAEKEEACVSVTIPLIEGWSAYSIEETRQPLDLAEKMVHTAIDHTRKLNEVYFNEKDLSLENRNYEENPVVAFKPHDGLSQQEVSLLANSIRNAGINSEEDKETKQVKITHRGFTNIFAVHAQCHVLETKGQAKNGIKWLSDETIRPIWVPASLLAGHVWWHLGLFHQANGDIKNSLKIYKEYLVKDVNKDSDPFTLSDASSLIIRLALTDQITAKSGKDEKSWCNISNADKESAKQVQEGVDLLNEIWSQFDGSTTAKTTSLVPFFHAHKQLIELCHLASSKVADQSSTASQSSGHVLTDENTSLVKRMFELKKEATNDDSTSHSSLSTKKQLYVDLLETRKNLFDKDGKEFNRDGFRNTLVSFYTLACYEGNIPTELLTRGPSYLRVHDLYSRFMGGSIAQRLLLQFYFLWVLVVAKRNGFIDENDSIVEDAVAKLKMDKILYGDVNKLVCELAKV